MVKKMKWPYSTCLMKNSLLIFNRICPKCFEDIHLSNLKSVSYDEEAKILEIEFLHGRIYQYFEVPKSVYDGLMNADSHGRYFDRNIKKAGYRYRKIS